ncbi:hypothetical protein V1512DRAFT_274470 [Lipomyces arxii]|uniref:uncharacterized protein n=1 Tax=Lipomyces arxii TaxID=56418 RepID=UPI0034CE3361
MAVDDLPDTSNSTESSVQYQTEIGRLVAKCEELQRVHDVQEAELVAKEAEIDALKQLNFELRRDSDTFYKELEQERETIIELHNREESYISQIDQLKTTARSTNASASCQTVTVDDIKDDIEDGKDNNSHHYESEIAALRLDLAELHAQLAHAKTASAVSICGLESDLADYRAHNQTLLSELAEMELYLAEKSGFEKTSPDTTKDTLDHDLALASNLAEEILVSSVKVKSTVPDLETENKRLRDTNVSMALYVERITQKILETKGLEQVLESASSSSGTSVVSSTSRTTTITSSPAASEHRQSRKKMIGIGITLSPAVSSSTLETSGKLTPNEPVTSPTYPPHSPNTRSPTANTAGILSPSLSGYRRVSSSGQTTLRPLTLSEGVISPVISQDEPVLQTPPLPPTEGPLTVSKRGKRRSWLGF